jgi:hypothetical protein
MVPGEKKGIPFWKNTTLHFLIVAVASFLLLFFAINDDTKDWLEIMGTLKSDIAHVEKLRERLETAQARQAVSLSERFPWGYRLFAIDMAGNLVFMDDPQQSAFKVDWNQARLAQVTGEAISLTPPALYYKASSCSLQSQVITFSRKDPDAFPVCHMDKIAVYLSIFKDMEEIVIFLLHVGPKTGLSFEPDPPAKKSKF